MPSLPRQTGIYETERQVAGLCVRNKCVRAEDAVFNTHWQPLVYLALLCFPSFFSVFLPQVV